MAPGLKRMAVISSLLVTITVTAYWRVRDLSFAGYDDRPYVTDNTRIQNGLNLNSLRWACTAIVGANWHPLTLLSHMADCQLFGLNPSGHHLTSLTLHVANVLLLFYVLQLATGLAWRSAFVAGLFAVHPLNVESVAWIAERKNVLSTLFLLLTLLAYIWYARSPNWRRYAAVAGLFAMGLMSKPMLVTLPFMLLLFDYWPLERWRIHPTDGANLDINNSASEAVVGKRGATLQRLLLEKVPLILLSATSSIITVRAQDAGGALSSAKMYPVTGRICNALVSYVTYLHKMAWPTRLAIFHPYPADPFRLWQVGLAAAVVLAVTVIALVKARDSKFLSFGWFWYLGTLVPVIGLVQVGGQAWADRYAYVPLVGVFIILVWGGAEIALRLNIPRSYLLIAGVLAITVMIPWTQKQVWYWRDPISLFEHAQQVTSDNYIAYSNLGYAYIVAGRLDDAAAEFSKAQPGDPPYADSQQNLGMLCEQKGQYDQAIGHFKNAIAASPRSYDAYNKLGGALANLGRLDEASACFRKVLEIKPTDVPAHANLGSLSELSGDLQGAASFYSKAIDLVTVEAVNSDKDGTRVMAERIHLQMADLLVREGKVDEAEGHLHEALRFNPSSVAARAGLERISHLSSVKN